VNLKRMAVHRTLW